MVRLPPEGGISCAERVVIFLFLRGTHNATASFAPCICARFMFDKVLDTWSDCRPKEGYHALSA
eukprot:4867142-Karenia_brevis.AAC.1